MQLRGPTAKGLNDLALSVEAGSSQRSGMKESGDEKWRGERLEAYWWMATFVYAMIVSVCRNRVA